MGAFIFQILVKSEKKFQFWGSYTLVFAPMGVKFGTEEGTECRDYRTFGLLLRAKFYPHRCNDKGVGPPKLEFLLRFDQNVEYKRPAGAYPLRDFHKICRVCTSFQHSLGVKIWLDLLKGLWSYGGFKLRGSGSPKFSAPPSGETMRQTTNSFRGERTCSRSSITMPRLVGLGFHPPPGWPKTLSFFVCLSVCLSVTLLNVRVCAPDFAMKALEYRNDFDAVG